MVKARTLSESIEFLTALHQTFVREHILISEPRLDEVLKNSRVIIIPNHATPLSWVPVMTTLAVEFNKAGGGHRTPIGIVDRWFFSNPITSRLAEFLTQSDRPENFEQILKRFSNSQETDLVISPEGANTFFGNVYELQEFRSHRYIEISVKSHSPLLLVAHRGSESWSFPLKISPEITQVVKGFSSFFGNRLDEFGQINIPVLPYQLESFKVKCALYWPNLTESDLECELHLKREKIKKESLVVKQRLSQMLNELKTI